MAGGSIWAVSVMLSLLSVEAALGGDVSAPAGPAASVDRWQTYRSERGGFSVDIPSTWTVEERVDAQGGLVTLLTPPAGAAVSVTSRADQSPNEGDADLPNTRCKNVLVAERPGRTCLDTIAFSVSTTVLAAGKTYIITSGRKPGDRRLYDRILASFRISP
ncbi:MAG: hypothetical protein WCE48_06555 [Steroidobacteraceae bacterium]